MPTTICLYGRTGAGKTTQLGLLIEYVKKTTGKNSRLYSADDGGFDTIQPYIDLGLLEIVPMADSNPWIWSNKAVNGYLKRDGKWVLDKEANSKVGLFAFESAQAIATKLKANMEAEAALGKNVGGDTNTSFEVKGDGETMKIGTTKGFQKYAIPQDTVFQHMLTSFRLPSDYVVWTAGMSKDDDDVSSSKIIGPDVLGKALTGKIPQIFNYTFRIEAAPSAPGQPPKHILHMATHTDMASGNAIALANMRRPLDAPKLTVTTIEPADIVKALQVVRDEAQKAAKAAIAARLGLKV
jgi:energy-coupling factor transporter ATP-binding protein EcfA2